MLSATKKNILSKLDIGKDRGTFIKIYIHVLRKKNSGIIYDKNNLQ